jgi:hypothetical protein
LSLSCYYYRLSSSILLSQFGQAAFKVRLPAQSINLREKSIVSPPERSGNAQAFPKLAEQDLRFSMKMMFEPVYETGLQPGGTVKLSFA